VTTARDCRCLVFVIGRRGQEAHDFRCRGQGRATIHETLAERNGAGMRPHQFGDHWNDRRLNGLQSARFRHGLPDRESCGPRQRPSSSEFAQMGRTRLGTHYFSCPCALKTWSLSQALCPAMPMKPDPRSAASRQMALAYHLVDGLRRVPSSSGLPRARFARRPRRRKALHDGLGRSRSSSRRRGAWSGRCSMRVARSARCNGMQARARQSRSARSRREGPPYRMARCAQR